MKPCLALGAAAVLATMLGCASNTPTEDTDGGDEIDAQTDGETGCGHPSTACCPTAPQCEPGATCAPGGTCCAIPRGAACGSPSDCCGDLDCRSNKCCVASGAECRSGNECCSGLVCAEDAPGSRRKTCQAPSGDCGTENGRCCEGDLCLGRLECSGGMCLPCGAAGEICCKPPSSCDTGLLCGEDGKCAAPPGTCGTEGLPCCPSGDDCVDVLECIEGSCQQPAAECSHLSCEACTADPSRGCGWCDGMGCLPGQGSGPNGGNCEAGDWNYGPSACIPSDHCSRFDGDCGGCTTAGPPYCGYCKGAGTCRLGTAGGPDDTSCSGDDWQWLALECSNPCSSNTDGCRGCTSAETGNCGWCENTSTCHRGTAAEPYSGTCSGEAWNWLSSLCEGPDPCASLTGCGVCTNLGDTLECGFCASTSSCMSGDPIEPAEGSCADWRYDDCSGHCLAVRDDTCSGDLSCCGELSCRRGVTFPTRCCAEARETCGSGADCCGYMACGSGNRCEYQESGESCLEDGDCRSGACVAGSCVL